MRHLKIILRNIDAFNNYAATFIFNYFMIDLAIVNGDNAIAHGC